MAFLEGRGSPRQATPSPFPRTLSRLEMCVGVTTVRGAQEVVSVSGCLLNLLQWTRQPPTTKNVNNITSTAGQFLESKILKASVLSAEQG